MATFYSEQMAKIRTVPATPLNVDESHGKIRTCQFSYEQVAEGAIGTVVQLCKLPAGRVRLLGQESQLYHNLTTGTVDLDVGWAAHVDFDGDDVAADPDGLDDGLDCETAGVLRLGSAAAVLAEGKVKVFESQEGVIITATVQTAVIAADDTLKGYISYILD